MTKSEAIKTMREGKRLTHTYFTDVEWVTIDNKRNVFVFEDDVKCSPQQFWQDRTLEGWNDGWSIFNPDLIK